MVELLAKEMTCVSSIAKEMLVACVFGCASTLPDSLKDVVVADKSMKAVSEEVFMQLYKLVDLVGSLSSVVAVEVESMMELVVESKAPLEPVQLRPLQVLFSYHHRLLPELSSFLSFFLLSSTRALIACHSCFFKTLFPPPFFYAFSFFTAYCPSEDWRHACSSSFCLALSLLYFFGSWKQSSMLLVPYDTLLAEVLCPSPVSIDEIS